MRHGRRLRFAANGMPVPVVGGHEPAPDIVRQLNAGLPPRGRHSRPSAAATGRINSSLHLSGTINTEVARDKIVAQQVEDISYDAIEWAIDEEPTGPGDARIAKLIFNAGPDNAFTVYDLGGITGTLLLTSEAGSVHLRIRMRKPEADEKAARLCDLGGFSGDFGARSAATRLSLSVRTVNPEVKVEFGLPEGGITLTGEHDTAVTVSAASPDGTATSSFEIVLDESIVNNAPAAGQSPSR